MMRRLAHAMVFACLALAGAGLPAEAQTRLALYGAIAPQARAGQVGGPPLTFFLRMVNDTGAPVTGCKPVFPFLPAGTSYQTTDILNQLTGAPNTPVDVPAGGQQGFLLTIPTPSANTGGYSPEFQCNEGSSTLTFALGGTFSISSTPLPDVIAISATATNDGVARAPSIGGTAFMAVAGVNIGAAGTVTVTPHANTYLSVPAIFTVCETNAATGACLAAPAVSLTSRFAAGQVRTYTLFAQAPGNSGIPFWPDAQRAHLTFVQTPSGFTVGDTSAAITAPGPDAPPGPGAWLARFEEPEFRFSTAIMGVWPNGKTLIWGGNGIWGGLGSEWVLSLNGQHQPGRYSGSGNLFRPGLALGQSPLSGDFHQRLSFEGTYGPATSGQSGKFRAVFDGFSADYATSAADLAGTYDVLNGVNSSSVIGEATISANGTWTGHYTVSGSTNCFWSGPFAQEDGRNFFTITQAFQGVFVNCPSTISGRTFTGFAIVTALQANGAEVLNGFVTQETIATPSYNALTFRLVRRALRM